jgi:hypothetical protein
MYSVRNTISGSWLDAVPVTFIFCVIISAGRLL